MFSNRHTLGVIFNTDVTGAVALRRRRALVVDMIKAYLAPSGVVPGLTRDTAPL